MKFKFKRLLSEDVSDEVAIGAFNIGVVNFAKNYGTLDILDLVESIVVNEESKRYLEATVTFSQMGDNINNPEDIVTRMKEEAKTAQGIRSLVTEIVS